MTETDGTTVGKEDEITSKKDDAITSPDKSTGIKKPEESAKKEESKAEEDYEARFKGLQPKVQELAEANKNFQEERLTHLGKISELETELASAGKQTDEGKKAIEAGTKTQGELQGTIDSLGVKIERNTLIMKEFPDLAVMEAKGMLNPALAGDELKTYLNEMRSILKTQGVNAVENLAAGFTSVEDVKTGHRTQGDSVADIDQLMVAAMKSGDMNEVDRLQALLIKRADHEVFGGDQGAPAT